MHEINMKAVLRQTGLSADNLRAWEKRHGAVQPKRSDSGRRVYSDREVQRLRMLAELVRHGHTIGKVAQLSDKELIVLLNQSRETSNSRPLVHSNQDIQKSIEDLMSAIDSFDLVSVRSALCRIRFLVSPREFAMSLVTQIMFLLGKRIDEGRISIAQEHALSELVQAHMKRIYEDLESQEGRATSPKSLVFCTREGDPHDLGILIAATVCRFRGYSTHYIGKSLPVASLQQATEKLRPDAVVLSLSTLPKDEEIWSPQAYLSQADQLLPRNVEIWTGGNGAHQLPKSKVGRDIWVFESIQDLESKLNLRG
jgi:DNA-binding transcriptional MerR regulator